VSSCLLLGPPSSHVPPLSLHDALPIFAARAAPRGFAVLPIGRRPGASRRTALTVESARRHWSQATEAPDKPQRCGSKAQAAGGRSEEQRLNSSHVKLSYAVFCLKKKTR